jgi:hypothetical protein
VRRRLAYILLALALASAGPAAYAHWLSHLGASSAIQHHADDGDEHEAGHACELCAAFSGAGALGTAPAQHSITLDAEHALAALPDDRLTPCEALARFASRAPPFSR